MGPGQILYNFFKSLQEIDKEVANDNKSRLKNQDDVAAKPASLSSSPR